MKRIYYILIVCIMSVFMLSCGKKQDVNIPDKQEEKVQQEEKKEKEEKSISLQTDYHIEDYENGYLIVSKSDGILYGAIDRNNKNIIPVEYDSASFFDSELLKKKGKVFIETSYEKKTSVFNKDGNKIINDLDTSDFNVVEYETEANQDVPILFYAQNSEKNNISIYNEDGSQKSSFNLPVDSDASILTVSEEWVNEQCFIVTIMASSWVNTYLYSYDGKLLKQWKNCSFRHCNARGKSGNEYHVYVEGGDWKKNKITTEKIYIDENGICKTVGKYSKVQERLDEFDSDKEPVEIIETYHIGNNKENTISKSNDTWKYQTTSGDAVYDARYYSCLKIDTAYLLSNENKEACVITENGKKVLDYGDISYEGDEDYYYQNIKLDKKNFFSDFNSVCIVTKENEKEVAHFYDEKM